MPRNLSRDCYHDNYDNYIYLCIQNSGYQFVAYFSSFLTCELHVEYLHLTVLDRYFVSRTNQDFSNASYTETAIN